MRGWIVLGLGVGLLYYTATETNKLDETIAQSESMLHKVQSKIQDMTGTTAIKTNDRLPILTQEIAERLSPSELSALNDILDSPDSLEEFKASYCSSSTPEHKSLSQENIYFICDKI
ncbi:hypothetical protein GCM10007978_28330 [Shewanella hanedai]|uniref:Uncharacterized protein n=1 Tax=Shewanella hanedai TaxID=25 RepID=A0A553JKY4_SHEHA|nr:hypothetical protein [Shewanella hanedai]TRY13107.1 hypothetical protein FN961_16755 [Shewanella hanedai]GGI88978.1 hypothetical protein GCM10007978_28330 [Shewanella hanedai]